MPARRRRHGSDPGADWANPVPMDDATRLDPERWVDRHGDALYSYARLRLRDPDLAAEVVQETFLEALRARASFSGRSSERTWLIGILKHKVVDHFRDRARRGRAPGGPGGPPAEEFDPRGAWRAGPSRWAGDPARALEDREFREVFRRCLDDLPPIYADAFTLRELVGLDGAEVCQILDIAPTALWARLHRARLLLRRSLERRWFGRARD